MYNAIRSTARPFALADFRDYCGIDYTDDDAALQRSLDAAVGLWEKWTNYFVRDTTAELDLDFITNNRIPGAAVQAPVLNAVLATDREGTIEDKTADWEVQRGPAGYVVSLKYGKAWDSENRYEAVLVFTQPATTIPAEVRSAIYGIGLHLFRNRAAADEVALQVVPYAIRSVIQQYQQGVV